MTEIEAQRSDSYRDIIECASKVLNIQPILGKSLALFKYNGVTIVDSDLTVKGGKKWTLGSYLLACKKSPSQVKFGIGYVSDPDEHSCSGKDDVKILIMNKCT